MLKWILIGLVGFPAAVVSFFKVKRMNKNKLKYNLFVRYNIIRKTAILIHKLLNINLHVDNINVIKEKHEKGRIYVCNHQSVYDIVSLITLSKTPLIFISKIENSKNVILKTFADALDTLYINRQSIMQSMRVFKEAAGMIDKGADIVIFGEGTRSKDGNVAEMKAGVSALANFSYGDLYPVCLEGSKKVLKFNFFSFKKTHLYIRFFDKISNEQYKKEKEIMPKHIQYLLQKQVLAYRG